MNINPFGLVKVTAGKEKDKYFMICRMADDKYALICDGRGRKINNPKKKNIKHLSALCYTLREIKEKSESGKEISNSEVRKSIRKAKIDLGILPEE